MDLLYLIIFIVNTMISNIETVLLKKTNFKSLSTKKILFVSEEASLLQCAQRCKFRDKNAIVDYKDTTCRCISNEDDDKNKDPQTLSGIFLNEEIVRMELINTAFNKVAKQSSTHQERPKFAADKAIDGDLSTYSTTENYYMDPWWSVDLGTTFLITHMVLNSFFSSYHNRAIVVETRQKNDDAWLLCKDLGNIDTRSLKFECSEKTSARYVRIRSKKKCHVLIDEFEVYAYVTV